MPQSFSLELIPSCCGLIGDVLHFFIAVALLFVVLSTFFRPWITSEKGKSITDFVEYRGPMLMGLLIGGLVCGTIGNFIDQYAKLNPPPKKYFSSGEPVQTKDDKAKEESDGLSPYWTDKFYLSWTQFFADGTVTPRDSFWTRIGRMFGLAFVSLLAYDAYTKLFSQEILDWIIKRQRSHTLICGSGRIGTVLAKNLLQDKSKFNKVTVIEKDPNSPAFDELRELGANVMIADATLLRNLKRARCYLANEIFVVTGSDEANLDIVADVISTLDRTKKDAPIPKIYVHLNQMRLERIISEKIEKDDARLRKQILYFNPLEESMRDLFDNEVLSRRPKKPEEVAHYVIVGFGHTGQQLALFLAENTHFENLKRSRITIVYRSEEQASVNRFKDLYPRFFPRAQWVFCLPSEYNYADALWDVDPSKDQWTYGVDLKKKDGIEEFDYEQSKGVGFAVNGSFVRM
ncbi:MAG: NAD-binding protein, partial [Pirellula sp.]